MGTTPIDEEQDQAPTPERPLSAYTPKLPQHPSAKRRPLSAAHLASSTQREAIAPAAPLFFQRSPSTVITYNDGGSMSNSMQAWRHGAIRIATKLFQDQKKKKPVEHK